MASLKQIAKECNVSIKTVSRALHDQSEVSPDTRSRILEVSKRLNYMPNFAARSLKLQRTFMIGLLRFSLNIEVWNFQAKIVAEEFSGIGYNILQGIFKSTAKMKDLINDFKHKCDGLVIYSNQKPIDAHYLNRLKDESYPFVIIDPHPHLKGEFPTVSINREAGIIAAVESLGKSGRKRIGYLSPFREFVNRLQGFKQGIENLGMPFSEDLIIPLPVKGYRGVQDESYDTSISDEYMEAGYNAGLTNTAIGTEFDAILCFDDKVALGLMRGLYERGIRIPDQVALVGFDDDRFTRHTPIPLSTIRQPTEAVAQTAVEMMMGLISGKKVYAKNFSTQFIPRQSS